MKQKTKQIIAAVLAVIVAGGILLGSISAIILSFIH